MKKVLFTLLITISLIACKKNNSDMQPEHEKSTYRVFLIGKGDTTQLPQMQARIETVGIETAEDNKLRVDLIGYNGHGVYTVQVTNKLNCQVIPNWGWEGLTIDSLTPNKDTLQANEIKTYTLIGNAKEGKIKIQTHGDCGNSSTLIIYITSAILPIKYTSNKASYDAQTNKTIISFNVEDPGMFDWVLIQRLNKDHEWVQAALIACDHSTKNYSIKL